MSQNLPPFLGKASSLLSGSASLPLMPSDEDEPLWVISPSLSLLAWSDYLNSLLISNPSPNTRFTGATSLSISGNAPGGIGSEQIKSSLRGHFLGWKLRPLGVAFPPRVSRELQSHTPRFLVSGPGERPGRGPPFCTGPWGGREPRLHMAGLGHFRP